MEGLDSFFSLKKKKSLFHSLKSFASFWKCLTSIHSVARYFWLSIENGKWEGRCKSSWNAIGQFWKVHFPGSMSKPFFRYADTLNGCFFFLHYVVPFLFGHFLWMFMVCDVLLAAVWVEYFKINTVHDSHSAETAEFYRILKLTWGNENLKAQGLMNGIKT